MRVILVVLMVLGTLASPARAEMSEFDIAMAAYDARDYRDALAVFTPLAEQGDHRAQYMIGMMHRQGLLGVVNFAAARDWLRRAAAGGEPDAEFNLGLMYYQSEIALPEPGRRPLEAAADLFRSAAERGHAAAQLYLGHLHAQGIGTRRDPVEALKWYQLAAWQRNSAAALAMSELQAKLEPAEIVAGRERARDFRSSHRRGANGEG